MFNAKNQAVDLEKIYGSAFIDKKAEGYYPIQTKPNWHPLKGNLMLDAAIFYLKDRLAIDAVIKELTFASIALATYLFMQNTGRLVALKGFGTLIGFTLLSALVYNLYKASFKSLAPGLFCMIGGLVLLSINHHVHFFKFLSNNAIEYIIGIGAFFIAISLFKSDNS